MNFKKSTIDVINSTLNKVEKNKKNFDMSSIGRKSNGNIQHCFAGFALKDVIDDKTLLKIGEYDGDERDQIINKDSIIDPIIAKQVLTTKVSVKNFFVLFLMLQDMIK